MSTLCFTLHSTSQLGLAAFQVLRPSVRLAAVIIAQLRSIPLWGSITVTHGTVGTAAWGYHKQCFCEHCTVHGSISESVTLENSLTLSSRAENLKTNVTQKFYSWIYTLKKTACVYQDVCWRLCQSYAVHDSPKWKQPKYLSRMFYRVFFLDIFIVLSSFSISFSFSFTVLR